jgi:hypothetical protein
MFHPYQRVEQNPQCTLRAACFQSQILDRGASLIEACEQVQFKRRRNDLGNSKSPCDFQDLLR